MIVLLSPAKTLDFESPLPTRRRTDPRFAERTDELVSVLAGKSPGQIAALMSISGDLARLNFERYQMWDAADIPRRQAIFAFKGDVYRGLGIEDFTGRDLAYAQSHLRILSGLYGVLRPLDVIQPHRLEMGSKLETPHGRDLYGYWGRTIAETLDEDLGASRPRAVVNLASKEYFSSVVTEALDARVVSPVFRDRKNGDYKIIGFFAKRARGLMASWILRNRVDTLKGLKDFAGEGYHFSPGDSTVHAPVFLRG